MIDDIIKLKIKIIINKIRVSLCGTQRTPRFRT